MQLNIFRKNVQLMNKFSDFPCNGKQVNRGTKMCQHTDGQGDSNIPPKTKFEGVKKLLYIFFKNLIKIVPNEFP